MYFMYYVFYFIFILSIGKQDWWRCGDRNVNCLKGPGLGCKICCPLAWLLDTLRVSSGRHTWSCLPEPQLHTLSNAALEEWSTPPCQMV